VHLVGCIIGTLAMFIVFLLYSLTRHHYELTNAW